MLSAAGPHGMYAASLEVVSFPVAEVSRGVKLAGAGLVFDWTALNLNEKTNGRKKERKRQHANECEREERRHAKAFLFQQSSIGDVYAQELYICPNSDAGFEEKQDTGVRRNRSGANEGDRRRPPVQLLLPCGTTARSHFEREDLRKGSLLCGPDERW